MQELINFDVNEDNTTLSAPNNFGSRPTFFSLNFGYGFGTVKNGGGTYKSPANTYAVVPQSLPNVAVWSPDSAATIKTAPGIVTFALNSVYVGALAGTGGTTAPTSPFPVTILGRLQNMPVATCSYTVSPTPGAASTIVPTPACSDVDYIQISDNVGQYWFIDSMNVTLAKLANG